MSANRYNKDKPRFSLVPPLGLQEVAKVATMGAEKYDDWDWAKGLSVMETIDSLQRHLNSFITKESIDSESHLNHMAHVAWNALAIIDTLTLHPNKDDRPKIYESKKET